MLFVYYIWYFFLNLIFFYKNKIINAHTNFYPNGSKTSFNELPFFEKYFLTFFFKKQIFKNIFKNLKNKEEIFFFRKKNFPNISFFFKLIKNSQLRKEENFKSLIKEFSFYKNKNFYKNIENGIKTKYVKNNFLVFLILKNHLNLFYSDFAENLDLNFFYFFFLKNFKKKLINFNLNKYNQWFSFCFNKKLKKVFFLDTKKKKKFEYLLNLYNKIIFLKFILLFKKYQKLYKKNFFFFFFNFNNFFNFKIKKKKNWRIDLYKIRFKDTSINKYINIDNLPNLSIMYLRKNKVFNKSRYSRNRQLYRTGVYWCIWLNIVLVFGLYFVFYRFLFNFGYIWFGIFILLYSTIFSRVLKYNFFNIFFILNEFFLFFKWIGFIFNNFYLNILSFINFLIPLFIKKSFFLKKNFLFLNKKILDFFFKNIKKNDSIEVLEFWHGLKEKDVSFFRYKTFIHWFKIFFKTLIY